MTVDDSPFLTAPIKWGDIPTLVRGIVLGATLIVSVAFGVRRLEQKVDTKADQVEIQRIERKVDNIDARSIQNNTMLIKLLCRQYPNDLSCQ